MQPSVLLIEDQLFLVDLLLPQLRQQFRVETALTPAQAMAQLHNQKFDLALLDLNLDNSGTLAGLDLLPALHDNGAQVIVVSAHCTSAAQVVLQASGIRGFIDKMRCANCLIPTITTVLAGGQCLPMAWGKAMPEALIRLNNTSLKVLAYIAQDPTCSNDDIAGLINRSHSLVKKNVRMLLARFDCTSRYQLANQMRQHGYLPFLQFTLRKKK